jgi:hypothetical protein
MLKAEGSRLNWGNGQATLRSRGSRCERKFVQFVSRFPHFSLSPSASNCHVAVDLSPRQTGHLCLSVIVRVIYEIVTPRR